MRMTRRAGCFPQGRYDPERWKCRLGGAVRTTTSSCTTSAVPFESSVSEEGDGAFAVVDVDTLWRRRADGQPFHWKGRACKGYTKVGGRWLLIFHTGLLEYQ